MTSRLQGSILSLSSRIKFNPDWNKFRSEIYNTFVQIKGKWK